MEQLSLSERLKITRLVKQCAGDAVPVIAVGNLSQGESRQLEETAAIHEAGADAVILVTNQFAACDEDERIWMDRCLSFLNKVPEDIPLGFYECPFPYKRLISTENLKAAAATGRFYFLKDTCCDERRIEERLSVLKGTPLKLYNANTSTLLASLRAGACGFSGVMANFHPELYVHLCRHQMESCMDGLQAWLTMASLIERQYYPVNAKYHMRQYGHLPISLYARRQDIKDFTRTMISEVDQLHMLEGFVQKQLKL